MSEIVETEVRTYNCSDGKLVLFAMYVAEMLTRDLAELATRGVTAAGIDAMLLKKTAFVATPSDAFARSIVGSAVELKDAARESALTDARTLRTAAQNVYGQDSSKYKGFEFTGMDKETEAALYLVFVKMQGVGVNLQTELAGQGITTDFLDDFLVKAETYLTELKNVKKAETVRDNMTEDRIKKGNLLYKDIVPFCNTGRDHFSTRSEAKKNDYVIENFMGTDADNVIRTGNVEENNQVTVSLEGVSMNAFRDLKLTTLLTSEDGAVLELAARNSDSAPYDPGLTYLVATRGETAENAAGAVGYDAATGTVHIIIYNNTAFSAAFRLEIEQ